MCHLDYRDFLVESGTKVNIDNLDRLQVRAIRCIEYCLHVGKSKDICDQPRGKGTPGYGNSIF